MIVQLLLIGRAGSEFRLAAAMAHEAGADVTMADSPADALDLLRSNGAGLIMIDVALDVPGFLASLRAERFAVPVLACGIDAPAEAAVAAIRAGARDYLPLPPERAIIAAAIAAMVAPKGRQIGDDPALAQATALALAIAPARAPVLIGGEPGCGKELLARAIHDASGRSGRFVVAECVGIPADMFDSALFGHDAGSFPGAVAPRTGQCEKADRGTLLLRDVDRLTPASQARLLAALQDNMVRRIGGTDRIPLTARIIASTARPLEPLVAQGLFRADLLARLGLVRIAVPPLRERPGDIALLAAHFAERLAIVNDVPVRPISAEAIALLGSYRWPGNVRELEDVIHRAVLLATGPVIEPEAIMLIDGVRIMRTPHDSATAAAGIEQFVGQTAETVERELILHTLRHCRGNRTSASNILGISVRTMRNKLKSFIEAGIAVVPA